MDRFTIELCEIIHGLGERLPRIDTVKIFKSVLLKQMILLIHQLKKAAILHKHQYISIKHILYVLKDYKVTLIRVLLYYYLKDIIKKLSKLGNTENSETRKINEELQDTFKNEIVGSITNVEDDLLQSDPAVALATIDFTKKDLSSDSKDLKCIFYKLRNTIVDLKLNINITEEEIKKCNEARVTRANDISILLSARGYEGFEICRRKSFHGSLGEKLLLQVLEVLPWNITLNSQVKDILLFLAKETIHSLIDRVFEKRRCKDNYDENNLSAIKKIKYRSILVDEVTNVTMAVWKIPLQEIYYPYKEDDTIFDEQLIFDS
ncbi:uncharacterized protein LOC112596561 [Melanaphis sacchari]|uniref:uncharacterized protein LOC112596561 n=1 Tax=Melanaphis sacchari TaxID=742174 RepID=UPI000DC13A08|nr:uncharacterized protein LOC112596561 [Melanaphis sacchari]XP_025198100.1 uncharacterized protein LOC112596561 [Melanaphis sacchari]XP_025198102.1 uncharacterized protein LOC112596561 [Melanaphis sacchari]